MNNDINELTQKSIKLAYLFATPLYKMGQSHLAQAAIESSIGVFTQKLLSDHPDQTAFAQQLQQLLEAQNSPEALNSFWSEYKKDNDNEHIKELLQGHMSVEKIGFAINRASFLWNLNNGIPVDRASGSEREREVFDVLNSCNRDKNHPFFKKFFQRLAKDVCARADRHYQLAHQFSNVFIQLHDQNVAPSLENMIDRLDAHRSGRSSPLDEPLIERRGLV